MTNPSDEELDALVGSLHRAANNLRHEGFLVDAASCDAGGSVLTALRVQLADVSHMLTLSKLTTEAVLERADRAEQRVAALEAAPVTLAEALQVPEVRALVEALELAANRLHRCAIDYDTGSRDFFAVCEWSDEARSALRAIKEDET